ncbi:pro-epidermal growth factor [Lampris incognitus]|uniref:pro-epidermal growth factor n=1 Tax=Lampris incognitus TaxID=2546036 RepID=UPI0024B59957|nr:pro-epidermal growth factor [Lampris incognitus]
MLAAIVSVVLMCFMVRSGGAPAPGTACWDQRLSAAGRNGSCVDAEPHLIFGHGKAIHQMDLDGRNQRRLVAGVGSSILLDFHYREQKVYWADKHTGVIYKAAVGGMRRQKIFSSEKSISGLAVDWILNCVYWTSREKGTIKRIDTNGTNGRTLLRHLTRPSSIVVDPGYRFVFWLSNGATPTIERSDVRRHTKVTLVKTAGPLQALSIDRVDKRLFWVEFGREGESAIGSCDYNGNAINVLVQPLAPRSAGISLFQEHLYYTDAASRAIRRVNKYTGGEPVNINMKRMAKPPFDIRVVHPINQPIEDSPLAPPPGCDEEGGLCVDVCSGPAEEGGCQCSQGFALSKTGNYCEDVNECALWNHGCSLGCENVPGSYFCTCPQGYGLLPDRKTCREIIPCEDNMTACGHGCLATDEGSVCVCPEGSVLREDGQTCTGCLSADRGQCSQLCTLLSPVRWECGCLPGYQLLQDGKQCTAIGPPPYLLVASLADIRRVNMDGSGEQTLLVEPRGTLLALDYDPVQNKVYFASTAQKTIERVDLNGESREVLVSEGLGSPEGLAIDWINRRMYWTDRSRSTVDCSTLDGLNRETVVRTEPQKPRGIAVHPLKKKLFWTNMGPKPTVESASLEGEERAVIADSRLMSPTGLTIDLTEDRLFWCDRSRRTVETAALDGSGRRVLIENQVGRPFDLAVFEDRLWISDWEHQHLKSVHKRTGKKLERIHSSLVHPASVVIVHPLAKPGADVCLHENGGCSQVCESRLGFAHCSCLSSYIQSADGKSCLPAELSSRMSESGDKVSIKNKTLSSDGVSPATPRLSSDEVEDSEEGREPTVLSEKMVADQDECYSLRCDVNAQCLLGAGGPACRCLEGFTGDGQLCVELETTSAWATTSSPADIHNQPGMNRTVESCPLTHQSYCLYQGVCFYFPEIDSYACNCVPGYMGERCQFSDLEWWELQRTQQEKRRNVAIASCMVALISLLSATACLTYCYGTRRIFRKQPSVDNMSETSTTDDQMSETTISNTPRTVSMTFFVVLEDGGEGKVIRVSGCPVCPSCSPETVVFRKLLGDTKLLSDMLQVPSLDLARAVDIIQALQETLGESGFDELWQESMDTATQCNIAVEAFEKRLQGGSFRLSGYVVETTIGQHRCKEGDMDHSPVEDKVRAVKEALSPKNVHELRTFLGLVNYYGKFLADLSKVLALLYKLLHKDTKWQWGEEQGEALTDLLHSARLLVHYDPDKEFTLSRDASPYNVRAVLSHVMEDHSEKPICFASRTLTAAEKKYSQLDKEGLAIVFAVKRFYQYLYGCAFTTYRDHKPLMSLFSETRCNPPLTSARIQHWALTLSAYKYTMVYSG